MTHYNITVRFVVEADNPTNAEAQLESILIILPNPPVAAFAVGAATERRGR